MKLSIIILNYKAAKMTRQCLRTIRDAAPRLDHEIIVVDNGSNDGLRGIIEREFPDVRFIQTGANLGYAAGNNAGIRAAVGDHLMIVNPDIVVRPGSIEALVDYLDAHPDVGIVGPRLVRPDGSIDESCFRFPTALVPLYRRTPFGRTAAGKRALNDYLLADFDRKETREVDWLLGAVLLFRRRSGAELNLFDERYFMYFEDTDLCRNFWRTGRKVMYHPASEMVHFHERHSAHGPWFLGIFSRTTRAHIASCVKYFRKWDRHQVEAKR